MKKSKITNYLDNIWIETEFKKLIKTKSQKHLIKMCTLIILKLSSNSVPVIAKQLAKRMKELHPDFELENE